jgi:pyridoxal phosphate enzyme (YggS family)
MENYDYIEKNYTELTQEIRDLSAKAGFGRVTLVCVTKSGSDDELKALAALGAESIGENRPQEVLRRTELLRDAGYTPKMHEIGSLQRNKVKLIIENVALIHSLDSDSLAKEIEKHAERVGRRVPVLVEINSAEEESKGGIMPKDAEEFCKTVLKYPHLELRGLMTMGPVCDSVEDIRPYFKATRAIFDQLSSKGYFSGEPILSMGMSDSYAVAIEEGSTMVRVGRKLFCKQEKEI